MAEQSQLEEIAKTAPQGEKKEETKPSALENALAESSQAAKAVANTSLGAIPTGAAAYLFGLPGLLGSSLIPYTKRVMTKLKGKDYSAKNFGKDALISSLLTSAAVGSAYAFPFFVPLALPAFVLASGAYSYWSSTKEGKLEYKRLFYPSTYLPNILNPFYLASGVISTTTTLCKTVRKGFEALYDAGSAFGKAIEGAVPSPAPKPA